MAERKRGLGRGIGALIPDVVTDERPVDVFFPEAGRDGADDAKAPARGARRDPSEGMRRAAAQKSAQKKQPRRSAATGGASKTAPSSQADAPVSDAAADAGAAQEPQAAAGKSTARKAAAKKPAGTAAAKTAGGKAAGSKTAGSKSAGAKAAGTKSSAKSRAAKSTAGVASSGTAAGATGDASRTSVTDARESLGASTGPSATTAKRGTAADKLVHEQQQADAAAQRSADAVSDTGEDNAGAERGMVDAGELRTVPGTAFGMLPVEQIRANPRQPRTIFDEDALAELVHSIREVGVLQPIVVRVVDAKKPQYELIMGERRFRASQEAGLTEIPAIIREVRDDDLLRDALLENLHRADLNPLEEAAAYQQLLDDFSCTQEELSERIGRSRPQITNTLRLLRLPALVQRRVAAGVISQGHARAILGLNDSGQMEVLAQRVVAEGLSVRATEEAVVLLNRGEKPRTMRAAAQLSPELAEVARSIGDRLDTRVAISMGKRKGKISVEFANAEDLERILAAMGVRKDG